MPNLPTYDSPKAQQGLQVSDLGVSAWEQAAGTFSRVGRQLGEAASHVIDTYQQSQQAEDAVDFTNKSTDWNIKSDQDWADYQKKGGKAEDYLRDVYEPGQQKLLDGLRTDKGRQAAEMALAEQRSTFAKKIFGDEAKAASDNGKIALENSGTVYGTHAFDDPSSAPANFAAWTHSAAFLAGAHGVSAADLAEITQKGGEFIYGQSAAGLLHNFMVDPNPTQEKADAIKKILGQDDYRQYLGKNYGEYIDKLDKAVGANDDVQGEIAAQALPSIYKAIESGDVKRADQAEVLIAGDTHGDHPEVRQAEQRRQLADALAVGTASQGMVNVSDAAAQNALPALQARMRDPSTTPDQLAPLQRQYDAILKAIKSRDEGIKSDGAQYFLNNPQLYGTVNAKYQKFLQTKDPKDFAAYATAVASAERTINPANPVRILPQELFRDVAAQIGAATQDPEGALTVATTLSNLRTLTGPYWNGVAHELQANGVLKGGVFAAAQLMGDPKSWSLGQEIIRASVLKDEDLTLSSGKPRAAADMIAAKALKDLSATFAETTNGHELVDSYVHAISDVMRARGTVDATTAANLAQTMVLDRFNIRSNLRIPKNLDDRDVADGAENVMAHIDTHNIIPPPSFSGLKGEAQRTAYVQDVRDYGHWVTNAQGDGAQLRDQFGSPVYERNQKGASVPVEVPYTDLEKIGRGIRGPLNQIGRFLTNPGSLPEIKPTDGTTFVPPSPFGKPRP